MILAAAASLIREKQAGAGGKDYDPLFHYLKLIHILSNARINYKILLTYLKSYLL